MSDNTIAVILEYIQKNEEALKEFREDIVGLGEDTENTNKKTDENSDSNKKQSSSFTELKSAIGLAQQGYELLQQGLEATSGKTVAYADDVRKLQLATGQSSEEASRQLQLLSDFGIGLSEIEVASKKMTKNGLAPTIQSLADMADRYNALSPGQERNKFLFDELGNSGKKYAEVLSKGKEAILAMNDGIDQSLILSQQQVDAARRLQVAQDGVNDSYDAAAIALGNKIIPVQTEFYNGINVLTRSIQANIQEQGLWKTSIFDVIRGTDAAGAEIWQEQEAMIAATIAADEQAAAEAELTAALETKSAANANIIRDTIALTDSQRDFQQQQDETTGKIEEYKAKLTELLPWETEKRAEILGQIGELEQKYQDDATAFEDASRRKIAMMAIEQIAMLDGVAGFSNAEQGKAFAILETLGVTESAAARRVIAEQAVASALADGTLKAKDMDIALREMEKGYSIEVVLNTIARITGGNHVQSGGAAQAAGIVSGFSTGTSGWMTVPPGYPNDSYPVMVESGERFAVLPAGASAAPSGGSGMGGGNVQIVLQIQSPITILDQQQGQAALLEYIEYGVKTLQERGVI